jgi:hypothetical protein
MTQDSSSNELNQLWRGTSFRSVRAPIIPSRFVTRRLLVVTGLLVSLAAAGGVVSWFVGAPQTHFVSCSVARFSSPAIPPNPAAERDHLAILKGKYFKLSDAGSTPVHSRFLISQQLETLKKNVGSSSLVFYVATYAILDADGQIVLLTSDYDPGRPDSGLPLSELLGSLAESESQQKLLVLDICWPNLLPAITGGAGDVAGAIEGQLRAVPDPKRLVLCSCSPGQVAQSSESLGRSIFGYYFEQALQGAADRYGNDSFEDGRVTVVEAAQFVTARVDRWAMRNRARRQTPILLGEGNDFELTTCRGKQAAATAGLIARAPASPPAKQNASNGKQDQSKKKAKQDNSKPSEPHAAQPSDAMSWQYPDWLLAGWKQRDLWRDDGTSHLVPRLFQQLEISLLRYERRWWFMPTDESLPDNWRNLLADLERKVALFKRHVAGPTVSSLAAVLADGYEADPAVTVAVAELRNGMNAVVSNAKPADRQAAYQTLLSEFSKKTKDSHDVDVALALFEEVAQWPEIHPDRLHLLVGLIRARKLGDQWIETRFLDRLDQLATTRSAMDWNPGYAARMVRILQRSERVFCHSRAMPWSSRLMTMAAQDRHDAEFCFWHPGYVSTADIERAIENAESQIDKAVAYQAVFVDAWSTYAEAMEFLPMYSDYVNRYPAAMASWTAAVAATVGLAELIEMEADASLSVSMTNDNRLEPIRRATDKVRRTLDAARRTFTADSVDVLIRRCKADNARANVIAEVDAVLATPLLAAADRCRLWRARAALGRRFQNRLAKLDNNDTIENRVTPALSGNDPVAALRTEAAVTRLQAHVSLDLLRLGGMTIDQSLYQGLDENGGVVTAKQAHDIANLWNSVLRGELESAKKPGRQDRLSRVFPPLLPMGLLDNGGTNPTLQLISKQSHELWAWLADRYRYETREGVDPEFYANLAVTFASYLTGEGAPSVQIGGSLQMDSLIADAQPTRLVVPWSTGGSEFHDQRSLASSSRTASAVKKGQQDLPRQAIALSGADAVLVDVLNPAAPWLTITGIGDTTIHTTKPPLVLDVALDKGFAAIQRTLCGFTIRWTVAGRTYCQRVGVPALRDVSQVAILLSPDAKHPEQRIDAVHLRPGGKPTAYHLFVRNEGREAISVLVELSTGDSVDKPLEISAGSTVAVKFPKPQVAAPPKDTKDPAGSALPNLDGPLTVVVRDAGSGRELAKKDFPVEIIEPRQYVMVDAVRFAAKDADHNRLEVSLRSTGGLPGQPCEVQLKLDAASIPGLIGMGDGLFQGHLPADGTPLSLFARNLQLADSTSEQGKFSLAIDGVPRSMVFDTTFARGGGTTTPVEAIHPALRLSAPRTGRTGEPLSACIETDYAPATSSIEVGLGRDVADGTVEIDRQVILHGGRCRRIGFTASGKGGALMFDGDITDWKIPLSTTGIVGHRVLRARLLADDGSELAVVQQDVVLGNRPPEGVAFQDLPKETSNKQPLQLQATARRSIPGISDVTFFVGKPAENTVPKDAVTAPGVSDESRKTWSGQIQLKPTDTGKVPISARFTNEAGLSTIITSSVEVTNAELGGGKIIGKVVEGSIPQPGIVVVLVDAKGTEQAKATTDANGCFAFARLKSGKYTASASKPVSGRHGAVSVTVKGEMAIEATIELWL